MVMVNPGGPGMSGTQLASELGSYMHAIIGDDWDIIGFDPRGTGKSYPRISCFGRPSLYQLFKANTVLERGPELGSNMTDPVAQKQLLQYISELDVLVQSQYGLCSHSTANDLRYVGTTYVAKDIDYITTLLEGKDALLYAQSCSNSSMNLTFVVQQLSRSFIWHGHWATLNQVRSGEHHSIQ
jgi:pimeloyl-ACP methyl ester carboxylesterase